MKKGMRIFILFLLSLCIYGQTLQTMPVYAATGKKFIVVIDEWDALIRDEAQNQSVQEEYINFLRSMFKGTEPTRLECTRMVKHIMLMASTMSVAQSPPSLSVSILLITTSCCSSPLGET